MEKYIVQKEIFDALEKVSSFIPTPIYWEDVNSIIIGANKHVLAAVGLKSLDDYIGKSLYDLYPKEMADNIKSHNERVMKSGEVLSQEEVIADITTGELKYYTAIKAPLYDTQGEVIGVIGTSVNITELKKTQLELIKTKEAAEVANIAKTKFIQAVSHDLRNPITGVIRRSRKILTTLSEPTQNEHTKEYAKKYAEELVRSSDALYRQVKDILEVVASNKMNENDINLNTFNLSELIQAVDDSNRIQAEHDGLKFTTHIDNKIPNYLIGDYQKIYRVINNFTGNSIKFTERGKVTIKVLLISKTVDTAYIKFEIIDTGKGISKKDQEKIFEPFTKLSDSYKGEYDGFGLGLSISLNFIKLLGGKIDLESTLGHGSKFSFILQLNIPDHHAIDQFLKTQKEESETFQEVQNKHQSALGVSSKIPHVLLIEDNPIALHILQEDVKAFGLTVDDTDNGLTALKLAKKNSYDLILTDIDLPGLTGIEFSKKFRLFEKTNKKKLTPIIAISGHAVASGASQIDECINAGINEVASKPFSQKKLEKILLKYHLLIETNTPTKPHFDVTPNSQDINVSFNADSAEIISEDNLSTTKTELFQLDSFPLFSLDLALDQLNNKHTVVSMLEIFVKSLPLEKKLMINAFQDNEWEKLTKLAHKMKSGCLYIGIKRLSMACQCLEEYYKNGHATLQKQLAQQIFQIIDDTLPILQKFIQAD